MRKAGKFASDEATVFHVTATTPYGVKTTDTLRLANVMITRTDAQSDTTMGNSPANVLKILYYPGRSTVNGCYIKAPQITAGDLVAAGFFDSVEAARQNGALIMTVASVKTCGHIARTDHMEVVCNG